MQKPVMLLILDGWGYRANVTPDNAIEQGHTPNWHNLLATCPHCFVETSGYDVGLPEGQMGNSEVGHTNLGAGRVVMQDLPKIDLAIKDGSLEKNPTLVELINKLKEIKGTCHLMGLMSPGGVHSHQKHIEAVCGILQKNGINVESFDLSEVFEKVRAKADDDAVVLAKLERLKNYTDFSKVPASNALTLAKVSVVLDEYIEEYHLDALALRCWNEMETYLRICPCVLLSELNDRGIVASCEIDMCSAISMRAMSLASEGPAAVLDWNNNYGDDEDKIILFHCGPVAQSLMAGKGTVTEHKMFAKNDPGSGWGCNEGRIKPMPITISNCQTKDGKIVIYASEAKFTDDPIEDGYFGCGGVAEIPHLQDKCITLAKGGFKHHTAICEGHYKDILKEAFTTYLGYEWVDIDG